VGVDGRSGIDYGDLAFADEIRVRAGAGHHAGIRRGEARDVSVEPLRHARLDDEARLSRLLRIGPVDLEIRRIGAAEQALRAFVVERPDCGVHFDVAKAAHVLDRGRCGCELCNVAERCASRKDDFDLVALVALQGFARVDPEAVHGFALVVRTVLAVRRARDEEARIEAPRSPRRRDPVAEVDDLVGRDVQIFLLQQRCERALARVERFAPFFERMRALRRDRLAVLPHRDQDAGFLEAFTRGGDPVGKASFGQAELRARLRVGEADHAPGCARVAV
jgi:hypothetical protein